MKLSDSITKLKGLGVKKAEALRKLNIFKIGDFLEYYPKRYEDRREIIPVAELREGQTALIYGKVTKKNAIVRNGKKMLRLEVTDESGGIEIVFFNAFYVDSMIKYGGFYGFFGNVTVSGARKRMVHPDFFVSIENERGIMPIYGLTKGIRQGDIRKWQRQILLEADFPEDILSAEIRDEYSLSGTKEAVENIHFPRDFETLERAKKTLIFEELFFLNLRLLRTVYSDANQQGTAFDKAGIRSMDYVRDLPFELTNAQKRSIREIEADMEKPEPMVRLLQGDVGSGKTIVAEASIYKAVKNGYQAVLMAPTQLLAIQHFDGISQRLLKFGISTGLLVSTLSEGKKRELVLKLKDGEVDVLIGTHAIIQENVEFANLGLVIVDEQHRFGVEQRQRLSKKGKRVDTLLMTATPIPRSLATALYGSLNCSNLDELPPARKKIDTVAFTESQRKFAYARLLSEIAKGRQAYIVSPLIEESQALQNIRSAETVYAGFTKAFPNVGAALLHGAMKQVEKENAMNKFYKKEIDVLISTVVIEVGINIPNATVMLIENAERFGLAQLHQLRGRVGRGSEKSYCFLINNQTSEVANERIKIMCETDDGFALAEKDLELRGPGEFFGERQHGMPELKIAHLPENIAEFVQIRKICKVILEKNPKLEGKSYDRVREKLEEYSLDDRIAVL